MSAPLSKTQKSYLAQLARRAQKIACDHARAQGQDPAADKILSSAEAFRHRHTVDACGKHGLRCCSQDDYKRVEAHFLNLVGEPGRALNAHLRAETEPRRLAEHKVVETCNKFGFSLNYAEAICRRQNKGLGLFEVTPKVLWNLVFTLRNRGHARLKRQPAAAHTY